MKRIAVVLAGLMIGGMVGVVSAQDAPDTVAPDDPILACDGKFLATEFHTGPGMRSSEQAIEAMLRGANADPNAYYLTSATASEVTAVAPEHPLGEITVSVEKHDGEWFAGRLDQCQG